MKKFSTRLIALVMALTLVMSCGVFALAAEPEAMPDGNEEVIKLPSSPNVASPMGNVTTYIAESIENQDRGKAYTDTFALSRDSKIIWQFAVIGECHLKITAIYGNKGSIICDQTYKDESVSKITLDSFPAKTEVKYTLTVEGYTQEAVLLIKGETV